MGRTRNGNLSRKRMLCYLLTAVLVLPVFLFGFAPKRHAFADAPAMPAQAPAGALDEQDETIDSEDAFAVLDEAETGATSGEMVEVEPEDDGDEDEDDEEPPDELVFQTDPVMPSNVAAVYGTDVPGLWLEVFNVDGKFFKFTLYGIDDVMNVLHRQLKDEDADYFFRYKLRMLSEREVDFGGKLIFRAPARGEDARITKISTVLHCKGVSYHSRHPRVEQNKVSWLVAMPDWIGFRLDTVKGFEFSVYNAYDTRQKVSYQFETKDVVTDTLLYKVLRKSGVIRIEVPDPKNMIVTITDSKVAKGYQNSPEKPGAIEPFYHFKAIVSSKAWVEAKITYQPGQNFQNMDFYAGEYHRLKDGSNKYHATSTELANCSYRVEGNDVILHIQLPTDEHFGLQYVQQFAVDMNNGTILQYNIYNIY